MKPLVWIFLVPVILVAGSGLLLGQEGLSERGVISGSVANATLENSPLSDWEVTLQSYRGATPSGTASTRTDEKGRFTFQDLKVDPNLVYVLSTRYGGVEYFSGLIVLDMKYPDQEVDLQVFEGTEDDSHLRIDSHHVIIRRGEKGIRIQEIIAVRNNAAYTYLGKDGLTLRLSLPQKAHSIELDPGLEGMNIRVLEGALQVYEPIHPEGEQILYAYDLTVAGSSYVLIRTVDYDTKKFDIFLGVPGATMRSDQLELQEPLLVDEQQYFHLSGKDLISGVSVNILIENLPRRGVDFIRAGSLAAVAFITAVVLLFVFTFKRKGTYAKRYEHLTTEREALIEEIASLDNEHASGNMSEDDYRSKREEKKKHLLEITGQLRNWSQWV